MAIEFCDEENAQIFSRKEIKKIAAENGLVAGRDFQKKRVDGGWKAFCEITQDRRDLFGMRWGFTQTLFWCA